MKKVRVSFFGRSACPAIFLACALLLPACNPQPKVALRLNLEPGRTYTLSVRTTVENTITQPDGSSSEMRGRSDLRLALRAEETTAEGDTVILVDPEKAAFPWFFNRINKAFESASFRMRVTPTGRIRGFTGTDEMRNSVREALDAAPPSDSSALMGTDKLLEIVSDESLTALLQPILAVWPTVPVATGDEWTRDDIYIPLNDTVEKTTFRLTSMEGGMATITMTSTFAPGGKKAGTNISGKSSGEVRVLTADGTIRAYRSTQTIEGTTINATTNVVNSFSATAETHAELTAR